MPTPASTGDPFGGRPRSRTRRPSTPFPGKVPDAPPPDRPRRRLADAAAPVLERLEGRRLLAADPTTLRVNFQPANAPTPAGYVADVGRTFGDRGDGLAFGWDRDNAGGTRDRNTLGGDRQAFDTLNHLGRSPGEHVWEAAVPSGTYRVRVVAGDPAYTGEDYRVEAESVPVVVGTTGRANPWIDRTATVTVTDGRLTIRGGAARGNKIAFVEITPADGTAPTPTPEPTPTPTPDPTPVPAGRSPFGPSPAAVPGRVEAEDFDRGGEGVGSRDADAQRRGGSDYRADGGTDVQTDGGDRFVGWIQAGEWMDYTVKVAEAGTYDLAFRVASNSDGGRFHAEIDGRDVTGPLALPKTYGWTNWRTVTKTGVSLPFGTHTLRVSFDAAARAGQDLGNLDYVQFTRRGGTPTTPTDPTPPATPAPEPTDRDGWPTSWRSAASLPEKRFEPYGFEHGGRMYVLAGWRQWTGTMWLPSYRVDRFDPAANSWQRMGDVKAPETHAGVAVDHARGEVYFVGGERGPSRGQQIVAEVWKWTIATDAWTRLAADLPDVRTGGAADLVGRELHYFGGNGLDREAGRADHWALDLDDVAAGWTRRADMPMPRDHFSSAVLGGKVYAIGGEFGHDILADQQSLVHRYDPSTDAWTRLADLPTVKSHTETATFVLNGKIVVAGGQTEPPRQASTDEVVAYDPATNRWERIGTLPAKLQGTVVVPIGGKIYVTAGGKDGAGNPQTATRMGELR